VKSGQFVYSEFDPSKQKPGSTPESSLTTYSVAEAKARWPEYAEVIEEAMANNP
jgi:hypothetical protein